MFYSTLLVAATAFTGLVSAQNGTSGTYSTSGPLTIDPNTVDPDTRLAWCRAQTNSCPQICGGQASPNTCDPDSLTYACTCSGGNTPNISAYDQTIPSLVCGQWKTNCVAAHPNDLTGQTGCLSVQCGTRNASSGESSSSSASSSATASSSGMMTSATASSTGGSGGSGSSDSSASATGSSAAAAASSSSGAVAMSVAMNYGTGILATGLLAVFGLAL